MRMQKLLSWVTFGGRGCKSNEQQQDFQPRRIVLCSLSNQKEGGYKQKWLSWKALLFKLPFQFLQKRKDPSPGSRHNFCMGIEDAEGEGGRQASYKRVACSDHAGGD